MNARPHGEAHEHYDGLVSRYLNRPLSRPTARALKGTPLTPNMLTGFTLLLACAAGAMVAAGWFIAGGILIQVVSVVDGVDGELARLKNMATKFGAVFDAVTDRYADAVMLAGMTVYAVRFEDQSHAETVGLLALAGALVVSYSRARIEASLPEALEGEGRAVGGAMTAADAVLGLGSRDVRSLIAAVGTVMGQCYWTLVVLAVLTGVTIAWRLLYLRMRGIGTSPVA
ncbi:MAG: CDP-alcohol phosphatidyltransferase family protein [Dehalococcoidia bacterium]